MDRLKIAKELREEADRLEREHNRPRPKKWKVGHRVRFLRSKEWAWREGMEATIVELDSDCRKKAASEYQVFWTEPDSGNATWFTTPDDVELVT